MKNRNFLKHFTNLFNVHPLISSFFQYPMGSEFSQSCDIRFGILLENTQFSNLHYTFAVKLETNQTTALNYCFLGQRLVVFFFFFYYYRSNIFFFEFVVKGYSCPLKKAIYLFKNSMIFQIEIKHIVPYYSEILILSKKKTSYKSTLSRLS